MRALNRRPLIFIAAALVSLIGFAALLCAAYVVRRFSYYQTTAFGMSLNVNPGDIFLVDRFAYDASRGPPPGDVIAFSGPTFSTVPGGPLTPGVKRVVAGPGDLVTISGGNRFAPEQCDTKFRLATTDYAGVVFLPRLLRDLEDLAPNASLNVTVWNERSYDDLGTGRRDAAIMSADDPPGTLYCEKIVY